MNKGSSRVVAYEQDENLYHEQQIWWVEPLHEHEDTLPEGENEFVYSITNPSSGRSLDMHTVGEISKNTDVYAILCEKST